jgi:hypothetical protein
MYQGIAQFLGSIPSNSVSLIRLGSPIQLARAPITYSDSWPWESFEEFERYLLSLEVDGVLVEFMHLGVSIRKIAQRFSDHHPESKTRVQATLDLTELQIRAVENGEIPLFKAKLEEELGRYVNLEMAIKP